MVSMRAVYFLDDAYCTTADEIKNLREEARALKQIRESMGSEDFSRKIFEKVFTHDINRLRSMEDMWKTRKPPQALNYDEVAHAASSIAVSVAQADQITWTLHENFTVFTDR